jgi:hypothetical protein
VTATLFFFCSLNNLDSIKPYCSAIVATRSAGGLSAKIKFEDYHLFFFSSEKFGFENLEAVSGPLGYVDECSDKSRETRFPPPFGNL